MADLMLNMRAGGGTLIAKVISHLQIPLFRNGYALTASTAITSLVGFGYWLVAARFYPVETVGTNSAAITVMTVLTNIAGFYLDGTLVRFIPRAGSATVRLVGFAYGISLTIAAVVSSIFILGLDVWSPNLGMLHSGPVLSIGFVLATMGWAIFEKEEAVLTGLRKAVWVPIGNAAYAVAKLALLIVFAAALPMYGILASWTVPTLMLILPLNFLIFTRLIPRHSRATQKDAVRIEPVQIVKYAGANHLGSLIALAYTMLPPVIVLGQAGSSASAYFYMPWMIAGFLRTISLNMSTSLTVEGAMDETQLALHFRRALVSTVRLLVPAIVCIISVAPFLLGFFGKAYAAEGVWALCWLSLATIPNVVVMLYLGFLRVQNRISWVVAMHTSLAVATLSLSYLWLKSYGIAGVGLAWFVSQTGMAAFLLLTQLRPILQRGRATAPSEVVELVE
jgi:O-antigen/teichoic acid export membrane protein